jgi:hypothetical protein
MSSEDNIRRRKARQACEQCRQSKRKCDGKQPCYFCRRYEHVCIYSSRQLKRARVQNGTNSDNQISTARLTIRNSDTTTVIPELINERSTKQSKSVAPVPSGNIFARGLMAELSNGEAQPFQCDSWNLGLRLGPAYEKFISDLVKLDEARNYSRVYFEKVSPIYSIVNQADFWEHLQNRLRSSSSQFCEYDVIICGVIALGSLFSGSSSFYREPQIVEFGQTLLEKSTPVDQVSHPSHSIATAWILRVLYLRMAVDPRAAWQASRSSVLALEGHASEESQNEHEHLYRIRNGICAMDETQIHRKLHWIARLLDTWIHDEFYPSRLGRDIVTISCSPPLQSPSGTPDLTSSLISLYVISLRFSNSSEQKSLAELTQILNDIGALSMSGHDVLQLHKSNHALCMYRFMRCTSSVISKYTLVHILSIAKPGLAAAIRLAKDNQPW